MKLLDRILHRDNEPDSDQPVTSTERGCQHLALIARWDDPADIGVEARASSYVCGTCEATFSAEEGRMLRETEAERIRSVASN
jgi:hypothetical protein